MKIADQYIAWINSPEYKAKAKAKKAKAPKIIHSICSGGGMSGK
jgi:hypothetical protein